MPPRPLCRSLVGVLLSLLPAVVHADYWQPDPAYHPVLESPNASVNVAIVAALGDQLLVTSPYAVNGQIRHRLARLNADGSLDPAFAPPASDLLAALAVYPDGRVLAQRASQGTAAIVRLKTDGSLDPAFHTPLPDTMTTSGSISAALTSDGRILVWGYFQSLAGVASPLAALLNDDGSVATDFHSPFSATDVTPHPLYPLSDGRILVAGVYDFGPNQLDNLARLKTDGSIDPTFNANAITFTSSVAGVFPQSDGKLLVADGQERLIRLNADGTLDSSYAAAPVGSRFRFGPQQSDGAMLYINDALQPELRRLKPDGSPDPSLVVTAPTSSIGLGATPVIGAGGNLYLTSAVTLERHESRHVISRILANGTLDASYAPRFSNRARIATTRLQPDDKVLVAGAFDYVDNIRTGAGFGLVRLNPDGSPDGTFAEDPSLASWITGLHLQPDGKIIVQGPFTENGSQLDVARILPNGQRDRSFVLPSGLVSLVVDSAGLIYGGTRTAPGATELHRYTVDGALDPTFQPTVSTGDLIAPLSDGTVIVSVREQWSVSLARLNHDGTVEPGFAPKEIPPGLFGLIPVPGGGVIAVGSTSGGYATSLCFVRLTIDGTVDYKYYAPPGYTSPPLITSIQALQFAGVAFDALLDTHATANDVLRIQLDWSSNARISMDVTGDGRMAYAATTNFTDDAGRYVRTEMTSPSVDPVPRILLQPSDFTPAGPWPQGSSVSLVGSATGLFPLSYQWLKDDVPVAGATSANHRLEELQPSDAGNYTLKVTNAYGSATSAPASITVDLEVRPATISAAPAPALSAELDGNVAELSVSASGNPIPKFAWMHNGASVAATGWGSDNTGYRSYLLLPANPSAAGIYTVTVTGGTGTLTPPPTIFGIDSNLKTSSGGSLQGTSILHPNGRRFDQVLLTDTAVSVTADPGKVTRTSYIDLDDDIVQVEFSGAGTLTLVLDSASGPAEPVNYHQPGVSYRKGHAAIVITGADETTNLGVFTVGRATAFDPTGHYNIVQPISATNDPAQNGSPLFEGHANTAYDAVANLSFIAIQSRNGSFGGVRTANASYFASKGFTGLYAPGVQFTGPVFVGDINAYDTATPVLVLGEAADTRITGGALNQANGRAVQVSGISRLRFVDGTDSQGRLLSAQRNQARLEQDGVDVTNQIVENPSP